MRWSGYFGIENIALTAPQKATLVAALRSLGPSDDPQPAELMHSRTRLDNDAVIFRARFQDGALTVWRHDRDNGGEQQRGAGLPCGQRRRVGRRIGAHAHNRGWHYRSPGSRPLTLPYRLADVIGVTGAP